MKKTKPLVMIVDDNPTNIDVLVDTLKRDYRLRVAKTGAKAIACAETQHPDLILLDVMMPGMNGFDVCVQLKENPKTADIPVIFITAVNDPMHIARGFEVGAVDYVTKPFYGLEVLARVQNHLTIREMREALNAQNTILEQKVKEKTAALEEMFNATIQTMALAVEIRDPYTAGHQTRVAALACTIAQKMGLPDRQIETIRYAGLLHDIGKIRIPAAIMNRPGKLLPVEREIIHIHPQVGYDLLKNIPFPWPIAEIVYQHHEKLDGSGYPRGLAGDEILLEARVLGVADLVEAESSHRPYRPTMGIEFALAEIEKNRGILYDERVVDACLALFREDGFSLETLTLLVEADIKPIDYMGDFGGGDSRIDFY
ncbi:MAG: response regulator [Desulfobacterales bacterium]|nr:response regulator [Desulfobacterales bacterium]